MRVLRVEHVNCPNGRVHGPAITGSCWEWDNKPRFGSRGPTPEGDSPMHHIKDHEVCGVLPEQFDAWWGDPERNLYAHAGWAISEYEVPDEDVVVLRWQVVFPLAKATRVLTHSCPKQFIACRRPDLTTVEQSRYAF